MRTFFAKGVILSKSNFTICIETFDAMIFLLIAFQPNFLIWMCCKGFEEGRRTFPMEVDGTDKRSGGVERESVGWRKE